MSSVQLKISGSEKVIKNLDKILKEKLGNVVEAIEVTQALVVNDAKAIVPVRTSFLRNSIQPGRVIAEKDSVDGEVVANAQYASYVEYGTSRQRAKPYLVPSIIKNRSNFLKRLKGALKS